MSKSPLRLVYSEAACDAEQQCQHCLLLHPVTKDVLPPPEAKLEALRNHRLRDQIHLARGETLFARGRPAPHIARLVSGALRLGFADDPESLVGVLFAPGFLGPMTDSGLVATALCDVELCCFAEQSLHRLFHRYPHLQGRFLEHALEELARTHQEAALLHKPRVLSRVAALLWMLARDAPGNEFVSPLRRADMAALLCTTTETVSRCLSRLRRESLIQTYSRNGFAVRDISALRAVVNRDD